MPVTLHTPPASDLTLAEIARWAAIPVAVALDLGRDSGQIDPAKRPLRPAGQQPRLFGQAVTVRCEAPDFGAVLHALDVIQRGQVLVIDAAGHRDTAMIGDILSVTCATRALRAWSATGPCATQAPSAVETISRSFRAGSPRAVRPEPTVARSTCPW